METITTLRDETISQLQDLVRINIDSAEGFETAAKQIDNAPIAAMFREHAGCRREAAVELKRFVAINDADAELDGTLKGRLHRWWIDIRGRVQDGDEHAILAEAERGEDAIKACYEDTLKTNPGTPVSDVLHEQLRAVKATHDRIRDMRDARAGGSESS